MFRFSLSEFLDKFILLVAMVVFLLVGISSIKSVKILDTISLQDAPMLSESKVDVDVFSVEMSLPETPLW